MELKRIIINGTTPFSVVIKRIIEQEMGIGIVLGFTTLRKLINEYILDDLPIIATEDIPSLYNRNDIVIVNTVGYSKMNTLRKKAQIELEELGLNITTYISSKANVYSNKVGRGSIIMPGSFVGPDVEIGTCNIIYSNVSLTHHITIGDYNFIGSGCVLGGNIRIHDNCFIGLNSTLRNRLVIPSYTLIGCSSNVVKSIEGENSVWVGNPAKQIINRLALETIIR